MQYKKSCGKINERKDRNPEEQEFFWNHTLYVELKVSFGIRNALPKGLQRKSYF